MTLKTYFPLRTYYNFEMDYSASLITTEEKGQSTLMDLKPSFYNVKTTNMATIRDFNEQISQVYLIKEIQKKIFTELLS